MPSSGNPTWQDSPSTVTPINAARLQAIETALTGSAPVSSAWTANTPVKAGQLLTNAGTLYSVNADMTTPSSFATTGLTVVSSGSGGGGASLAPTAVKTSAYMAAASDYVPVDTTSGSVTITLPTAPADKTQIGVKQVIQGGTNTVTIACGGSDVFDKTSGATTTTLTLLGQNKFFQYKASGALWYIIDDSLTLASLDARYPLSSSIAPLAQSGQTPSQAPIGPSGSGVVGTLAFAARADHSHPTQGALGAIFGFSTTDVVFDGTSTIAGFTRSGTTYTQNGNATGPYRNVTINSGVTVIPNQPWLVCGTFNNAGTFANNGVNSTGNAGGGQPTGWSIYFRGSGGGNGGTAAASGLSSAGTGAITGNGGTGGAGSAGANAGGAGQSSNQTGRYWINTLRARQEGAFASDATPGGSFLCACAGGGGGGDGTSFGGGGGGASLPVVLCAATIVNSGTISSNGGNGAPGQGGNAGGGAGASGGVVLITTVSYTNTGSVVANPGTGGAGVGTGAAGQTGGPGLVDVKILG